MKLRTNFFNGGVFGSPHKDIRGTISKPSLITPPSVFAEVPTHRFEAPAHFTAAARSNDFFRATTKSDEISRKPSGTGAAFLQPPPKRLLSAASHDKLARAKNELLTFSYGAIDKMVPSKLRSARTHQEHGFISVKFTRRATDQPANDAVYRRAESFTKAFFAGPSETDFSLTHNANSGSGHMALQEVPPLGSPTLSDPFVTHGETSPAVTPAQSPHPATQPDFSSNFTNSTGGVFSFRESHPSRPSSVATGRQSHDLTLRSNASSQQLSSTGSVLTVFSSTASSTRQHALRQVKSFTASLFDANGARIKLPGTRSSISSEGHFALDSTSFHTPPAVNGSASAVMGPSQAYRPDSPTLGRSVALSTNAASSSRASLSSHASISADDAQTANAAAPVNLPEISGLSEWGSLGKTIVDGLSDTTRQLLMGGQR